MTGVLSPTRPEHFWNFIIPLSSLTDFEEYFDHDTDPADQDSDVSTIILICTSLLSLGSRLESLLALPSFPDADFSNYCFYLFILYCIIEWRPHWWRGGRDVQYWATGSRHRWGWPNRWRRSRYLWNRPKQCRLRWRRVEWWRWGQHLWNRSKWHWLWQRWTIRFWGGDHVSNKPQCWWLWCEFSSCGTLGRILLTYSCLMHM